MTARGGKDRRAPGTDPFGDDAAAATLTDRERGLLAGAVLAAAEDATGDAPVARLGLESADPGLMSRAEVARLIAYLRHHKPAACRRALATWRDAPAPQQLLDTLFAPSRGDAATGRLGTPTEPTMQPRVRDEAGER